MLLKTNWNKILLFTIPFIAITACKEKVDPVIPEDTPPVISLTSSNTLYVLAEVGEEVSLSYTASDNQQLKFVKLSEEWIAPSGAVVQQETDIPGTLQAIAAQNFSFDYTYTVPPLQVYSTINIFAYAEDNKGREAKIKYQISVIPPRDSGIVYDIQEYLDGDTIYSLLTGAGYNFDIYARERGNDLQLPVTNRFIRENSSGTFNAVLTSPIWGGQDSVLVTTNESVFNFNELTYVTTDEAFITSNRLGRQTDPLSAGDIVILKLPTLPHYAIFYIQEVNFAGGFIVFKYKYSYQ